MKGNPYPGTREFGADEKDDFFGRREEIDILAALVQARRTSLLFAQSGAGKSSLINAGLIPELTRGEEIGRGRRRRIVQKMHALPVASVGGGIPSRLGRAPDNVYIFSALHSLFPEAEPDTLAGQRLVSGIAPLVEAVGGGSEVPVLLVFDQFEELFTHHVERWRERLPFFEQVAEALREQPELHVLFSMREDFIAELTPFADLLPAALRDRFRLERLRPAPALEAVRGPAAQAGSPFAEGVPEELVDNLRRGQAGQRRMPEAESCDQPFLGEYVEPVHLQIVCRRLWDNLDDDRDSIEQRDLKQLGDVDQALIGFYQEGLRKVLERTEVPEHRLRSWFEDTTLITPARTRGLVYRSAEATEGLPNAAVDELVEAYLIRSTQRGSDTWYELAHDRLVEPILVDNREWRAKHLRPLTVAAEAWKEADRDPRKLYSGAVLAEVRVGTETMPGDYSRLELEFVAASLKEELTLARNRRRQLGSAIGIATILAVAAVVSARSYVQAEKERARAETAESVAISRELAAYSADQIISDPEVSLLLALEAVRRNATEEADSALRRALLEPQVLREWTDVGLPVAERFNPGGRLVATRDEDELVILETVTGEERWRQLAERLTWSSGGKYVATSGAGRIEVWDTAAWQRRAGDVDLEDDEALLAIGPHANRVAVRIGKDRIEVRDPASGDLMLGPFEHQGVTTAIFSPDGKSLVAIGGERWSLWPMGAANQPIKSGQGNDAAFDEAGERLAVVTLEGLRVWAIGAEMTPPEIVGGLIVDRSFGSFKSTALRRDGHETAVGDVEGAVGIATIGHDVSVAIAQGPRIRWKAHQEQVNSVAFNTDGDLVLTASGDRTAAVWTARSGRLLARLRGHRERILTAVFGPEDGLILTSSPQTARLWRVALPRVLPLDEASVELAALSPDGRRLVVVRKRKTPGAPRPVYETRVWDTENRQVIALDVGKDPVRTAVFSPERLEEAGATGSWVAIATDKDIHGLSLEGRPGRLLTGHEGKITGAVFSANGEWLLSTAADDTVRLWDWPAERQLRSFPHARGATAALSPGADRIVTSNEGKDCSHHPADDDPLPCAKIWSVTEGGEPIILSHPTDVEGASFDPDGRRVVTAGKDGTVRLWQTDGKLVGERRLSEQELYGASFSPDGRSVVVWGRAQTAYLWRPQADSPIVELPSDDSPRAAFFSADGRLVLTHDGTRAQAWDTNSANGRWIVQLPLDPTGAASSKPKALSWSADGLRLAVAWRDGRIELYTCDVCRPLDEILDLAQERLSQRWPPRRRYLHQR